jgi:LysM repeat protein
MKSRMLLMIIALVVLASLVVVPAASGSPLPGKNGEDHEGKYCSYRVKWGDTLSRIADRYDTSVWHLKELNRRVHNPNCIYAGEWITVPCDREENNGCSKGCGEGYRPVSWGNDNGWGKDNNGGHKPPPPPAKKR